MDLELTSDIVESTWQNSVQTHQPDQVQHNEESINVDLPDDTLTTIQLSGDFLKTESTSFQPKVHTFTPLASFYQTCDALDREDVDERTLILAAFQVVLSRYTQQTTLDLPTTFTHDELGKGYTTLLRGMVNPAATVRNHLQQSAIAIRAAQSQLDDHQRFSRYPTEQWANSSVALSFIESVTAAPGRKSSATGLRHVLSEQFEGHDLHLIVLQQGLHTHAILRYNASVFQSATIQRLAGHIQTVIDSMLSHPDRPIQEISLVTPAEAHQLLIDWSSQITEYPDSPIHQYIESHAIDHPNAIAVRFQDQSFTYAELNQRANQLAHYLIQQGVTVADRISVCLEPSLDIMVCVLGIFKAGGTYVPLDPNHPTERLATIIADTQPKLLLTQSNLLPNVPQGDVATFCLDQNGAILDACATHNPNLLLNLDQTAYVVYTSGTTGKPKGVMVAHRNLVHYILVAQQQFRFDEQDVMPAIARFTFSINLFELFSPLVAGGTLLVLERDHILDFKRMVATLQQVTVAHLSPSLLRKLLAYIQEAGIDGETFRGLKHISSGGDMVSADLLEAMRQVFSHSEIYVIYGSSEISCMGAFYPVPTHEPVTHTRVGKPFNNVSIRLYDEQQNLVPIGVVGEVYFSGAGIAQGYLNRDELTQEKFVVVDGQRFYRMGDVGRFDADGNLELLGRSDFQIKLRGIRIEPAEIEVTLRQIPGVRDAVVTAPELENGEKALVAYVVLNPSEPPTIAEMRQFLVAKLPDYMVPTLFIELEALPLNINQKVDRRALPSPAEVRSRTAHLYLAPQTPLEHQLADIWVDILGVQQVSRQDDFFALGGHSLMAAQVLSRLQATLNLEIPITRLFEFPTIAELAAYLETVSVDDPMGSPAIVPSPRQGDLPLSATQSRFWFMAQLEDSNAYNIPLVLQLDGLLNRSALEQSLTAILQRHEVLRTVFPKVNGAPVQRILPPQPFPLTVVEEFAASDAEASANVDRLAQAEVQKIFDLTQDLPIRGTLIHLDETRHVLLLTIHHIVCDGWSVALIQQELATLYTAFAQGQPSPLEPLAIQYADFTQWQAQWLKSEAVQRQLPYWQQQLAHAPALLELPCDRPRLPRQTYRGGSEFFTLSPELTQQLKTLSQRSGATLFMTLLASFATVLSRHSQHQDLVIGSPIANRTRRELEHLQGVFINLLALRLDLSGNPAFQELLQRVRRVAVDAFAHSDIPFESVVEALQPERNSSYTPLFQVLFILQNAPVDHLALPGLTVTNLPVESGTAKYDLTLMMEETEAGLKAELEFNRDLFDRTTIVRLVGHLQTLLAGVVVQPDQPIATLPLLTSQEQHQLLVDWNNTEATYPHDRCIQHLFEEQVKRTPEAIAAIFEDEQITYQELNRRANNLAHYLQQRGVGPDGLVGICLERSLDTIVGLLGILKAGGAYIPLDPSYPEDRIAYMVEDARLTVLITQHDLMNRCRQLATQQPLEIISIDDDWAAISQQSADNPSSPVTPKNLAYIIYTSGSTGKPKGVQIEHQALVNFLLSMGKAPGLTAADVLLAVTTISFDIAGLELYLPLIKGAQVVIVSREVASDGNRLIQELIRTQATVMQATPITWQILLAAGWQGNPNLKVLCGGEPMTQKLATQLLDKVGTLWNVYGPTETTVWSTAWQVESANGPIYIGYPIDNTQLYILDPQMQPVPIGVSGELYIGGDGLARGYLNRPDLTAERFVPNPFSPDANARIYRTGDLVRMMPDGKVECLGRIDHQVKVRGFRIELGEIETALSQHPQVRQCVVMARADQSGEKRLVAYVSTATSDPMAVQDYRQFIQKSLPEYMVPSAFVQMDTWPLTPNGKIDRKALPAPQATDVAILSSGVAPRTAIERKLVEIWEDLLNVKPIGIHDNFFDLGGYSLLTMRLSIQIEQLLGCKLSLSTILTAPTIAQLAAVIDPRQPDAPHTSVVLLRAGQDKPPVFMIHDGDGEILLYRSLAQQLDQSIPIYGIQPYSTPESPILHSRIDEAARYYVEQIQQVQPQGPYFLAGLCLGGVLAMGVAQHLQAQGESVKMLAMLDAVDVNTPQRTGYVAQKRLENFSTLFSQNTDKTGIQQFWYTLSQIIQKMTNLMTYEVQTNVDQLMTWIQMCLFQFCLDRELPLPRILQHIPVRKVLMWARQHYSPWGQFEGEILLFRATQKSSVFDGTHIDDTPGMEVFSDPLFGWGNRTTVGVQVHDVPGGHSSMLQEPNVQVLAEIMQSYIDTAIAKDNA